MLRVYWLPIARVQRENGSFIEWGLSGFGLSDSLGQWHLAQTGFGHNE